MESEQPKNIYCLKCRDRTDNKEAPKVSNINGRPSLTAPCGKCGSSKYVFVKKAASQ